MHRKKCPRSAFMFVQYLGTCLVSDWSIYYFHAKIRNWESFSHRITMLNFLLFSPLSVQRTFGFLFCHFDDLFDSYVFFLLLIGCLSTHFLCTFSRCFLRFVSYCYISLNFTILWFFCKCSLKVISFLSLCQLILWLSLHFPFCPHILFSFCIDDTLNNSKLFFACVSHGDIIPLL